MAKLRKTTNKGWSTITETISIIFTAVSSTGNSECSGFGESLSSCFPLMSTEEDKASKPAYQEKKYFLMKSSPLWWLNLVVFSANNTSPYHSGMIWAVMFLSFHCHLMFYFCNIKSVQKQLFSANHMKLFNIIKLFSK